MKTTFNVLIILIFSITANAQETKLSESKMPQAVLESFHKAFPNANTIGFSKEKDNGVYNYEVESMEGNIHRDVTYFEDGTLVSVEEEIDASVNQKF